METIRRHLHHHMWLPFLIVVLQLVLLSSISPVSLSESADSDQAGGGGCGDDIDNGNDPIVPILDPFVPPNLSGQRSRRFPSIEERIKVYMSNWYIPLCEGYSDGQVQYEYRKSTKDPKWTAVWIQEPIDTSMSHDNVTSYVIENSIEPDTAFFIDEGTIYDCANVATDTSLYKKRIKFRSHMLKYCIDVANLLLPALKHVLLEQQQRQNDATLSKLSLSSSSSSKLRQQQNAIENRKTKYRVINGTESSTVPVQLEKRGTMGKGVPIIIQFGDMKHSHYFRYISIPFLKKFRSAAVSTEALDKVTSISSTKPSSRQCYDRSRDILESYHGNHDKNNAPVLQPIIWKLESRRHFGLLDAVLEQDTQWSEKLDMAIFMGQLTGSRDGFQKNLTDVENCLRLRRCRLVYENANSTFIYARLTSTRGRLPNILDGVELVSPKVPISELLRYKAVIMLEGNDVASGLKWAMLSQSVVMMQQPKHTSWAMEELLQPWIHYVPISESLADVEEKIKWIITNDKYARRIAQRGSQWMHDLVYHPDAIQDDTLIQNEIIRRYLQFFSTTNNNGTELTDNNIQ